MIPDTPVLPDKAPIESVVVEFPFADELAAIDSAVVAVTLVAWICGALSGGAAYPSLGLEWDLNNTVAHIPLLGGESVDITQREPKGMFTLDLTAAQHVSMMATVKANATTGVGIVHGTTAGFKVLWPMALEITPAQWTH